MADNTSDSQDSILGALGKLAQDPIDSRRGWLAYAAGALSPTKSGTFGESFGNALGAMNHAQSQQEALRASYIPHVTQALIQAAQFQKQREDDEMIRQMFSGGNGATTQAQPMPGQLGSETYGIMPPSNGATAIPPQSAGSNASPIWADINKIAMLKAMRKIDLLPEYKTLHEGFERKPGSFYDMPDGTQRYIADPTKGMTLDKDGNVIAMPGFAKANADIKGSETAAQELAKARYDVLDPTKFTIKGTGKPFVGSRAEYLRQASGNNDGASGLDVSQLTPQQIDILRTKDPEAFANGVANFEKTKNGSGLELQSEAEKKQQLGQIDLTQGAQGELNKNWIAQSYNPVLQSGRDAQNMLAQLDSLKNIDLKTGWGTEAKSAAANMLAGLGVAPKNAEQFASNAQKFQSVAMERLWTVLNAAKGPQTEGDADRAKATFAKLTNTNEANQFVIDLNRARANADIRRRSYYDEMLPHAQSEGDLPRIDREWSKIQRSIWDDPIMQKWKSVK